MNKMNVGHFVIPLTVVQTRPDEVAEVMSIMNVVIVRAEALVDKGVISYTALSPRFREIREGKKIPSYAIEIRKNDDGTIGLVTATEEKPENLIVVPPGVEH